MRITHLGAERLGLALRLGVRLRQVRQAPLVVTREQLDSATPVPALKRQHSAPVQSEAATQETHERPNMKRAPINAM